MFGIHLHEEKALIKLGFKKEKDEERGISFYRAEFDYETTCALMKGKALKLLNSLDDKEKNGFIAIANAYPSVKLVDFKFGHTKEDTEKLEYIKNAHAFRYNYKTLMKIALSTFEYEKRYLHDGLHELSPNGNSLCIIIPSKVIENASLQKSDIIHATLSTIDFKKKETTKLNKYVVGRLDRRQVIAMLTEEDILTVVDVQKHAEKIRKHGYELPNHIYKDMIRPE